MEMASQELVTILLEIDDKLSAEEIMAFEVQNARMQATISGR